MLEHITDSRSARRRRPGPAVSLSLAIHGCALGGFLIAAAWRVDKLDMVHTPVVIGAGFAAPIPSLKEGPARPERPKRRQSASRTAITQPGERTTRPPAADDGNDGPADPGHPDVPGTPCPVGSDCAPAATPPAAQPICGDGNVDAGEECDDGGAVAGDGCSPACRREAPPLVAASRIEARRIAGDVQIQPPESVRSQVMRTGQTRVTGSIKMCLGPDGAVRSLQLIGPTGYPAYDERLISGMQSWRYEPYLVGGRPVPVCTVITFVYQPTR